MPSLNQYVKEYKKQLDKGDIKYAYQGLMQYMMNLRTQFQEQYPNHFVSSSIYQGQMNFTFFQFTPKALKDKKLKTIILLDHEKMSFEAWLCGVNKKVQREYWNIFKQVNWDKYHVPEDIKRIDSIIEYTLVKEPNFDDLDGLNGQIEKGTLEFIRALIDYLDK